MINTVLQVSNREKFLFNEVDTALKRISEKLLGSESQNSGIKAPERRICIEELEAMLQKAGKEFQVVDLRFIFTLPPSLMSETCCLIVNLFFSFA